MRWTEMAKAQPALGELAHDKIIGPGVLLVGTTRRDGSARISGVEPLLLDGELWLSMMRTSTKAQDLYRDPRILLHSIVTGPEAAAEIKIRGVVRTEHEPTLHKRYAGAVARDLGWQPVVGEFTLFAVGIDEVAYLSYDPDSGDQHVARWPDGDEYVRVATTPTSLGPQQPVRRILV
jgi:hypothetical protein